MEQYDRNSPDYYDQLQRVNFKKYLVIKDGQRVNSDLKLDPRVFYLEFVDDDGIFYGMQDTRVTEEEPEFYTIYKLKITLGAGFTFSTEVSDGWPLWGEGPTCQ